MKSYTSIGVLQLVKLIFDSDLKKKTDELKTLQIKSKITEKDN